MQVAVGSGTERVESLNVSANGVYFMSSAYLEPLTRLEIMLELPIGDESRTVSCAGVVVRVQPEVEKDDVEEYNIACYFTDVSSDDQDALEAYILQQMAF